MLAIGHEYGALGPLFDVHRLWVPQLRDHQDPMLRTYPQAVPPTNPLSIDSTPVPISFPHWGGQPPPPGAKLALLLQLFTTQTFHQSLLPRMALWYLDQTWIIWTSAWPFPVSWVGWDLPLVQNWGWCLVLRTFWLLVKCSSVSIVIWKVMNAYLRQVLNDLIPKMIQGISSILGSAGHQVGSLGGEKSLSRGLSSVLGWDNLDLNFADDKCFYYCLKRLHYQL